MEVKEKSKKRELIKSIAIVFLAVLLVLTFFSNTIMNRYLPEVATQSVTSGTINAKVRGTGTVIPNESYEVIIDQTREVRSVCVKVGDTVEEGDILFILEDVASDELKNAQEQLENLNLQYQQELLAHSKEYASEDRNIQVLREDLDKAIKKRDENLVTEDEISLAKGDLAAAENELTQLGLILEELNAMMGDTEEYAAAQEAVSKWTAALESAEKLIEQYTEQLEALGFAGSEETQRKIQDAENAVEAAKRTLRSDWMAYENTYVSLLGAVKEHYQITDPLFDVTTDAEGLFAIANAQRMYVDAYLTEYAAAGTEHPYASAYQTLLADYDELKEQEAALEQLRAELDDAYDDYRSQYAVIQSKLDQANYDYMVASQQLQQANDALTEAENNNSALKNQIKTYETFRREQNALVESLTEKLSDLETKKVLYDQAVELVTQKERAIEDALTGKNIDKQMDDLDLQAISLKIQHVQELVDKYTKESVDTEIKSNVSGTVSAINVSAGENTSYGAALAVIDVVDRGYIVKIPVSNEQSQQVKVGDSADVTNYYWGDSLKATLEAITADPDNPGMGKLLIFRITGEIDAGANITLSIGQRSASYDTIVPKSALRQDTNGNFVYVITVKSSPLSNRYIATRVDVNVLTEDDSSAAVSGLAAGDFVITTSSKPVAAGSQVRMVENP